MMTDMTMDNFLAVLSSSEPVPGGGGACGYVAAVGMSLGNMVLALTTGKKKYAEYQEEIEELIVKATDLTKRLAECMDKDAESLSLLQQLMVFLRIQKNRLRKEKQLWQRHLLQPQKPLCQ